MPSPKTDKFGRKINCVEISEEYDVIELDVDNDEAEEVIINMLRDWGFTMGE